ncbi:MAG: glycosyltransferase family 9 protein [Nitrospira sp.]|nr:glycosyltransferase family 9 protein [Nitrospira sp.]MCP9442243.1 glycosyltransferase family 9 protein [Nitrospira sp.]
MARALIVQLARLGDLMQTIPAITAIKTAVPDLGLDLLCPPSLSSIGRMVPGVDEVLEWDGTVWRRWADEASADLRPAHLQEAAKQIETLSLRRYDCAYVLNQHPRALLAGALLARETRGPRLDGPIGEHLSPWASYVRAVARTGRGSRVHLADALCGLCGVPPPGWSPVLGKPFCPLPSNLDQIGRRGEPWIGLIVGAGAVERSVPTEIWTIWIIRFLEAAPNGRVVLLGEERERGRWIHNLLPPSLLGRVWDVTGRTSLLELAEVLSRCHLAIGSDTGPLHLAAAVGTRVFGWYFARARVHETGPYGMGHLVWQAVDETGEGEMRRADIRPAQWPIEESIAQFMGGQEMRTCGTPGWSLWMSRYDRWGAYYAEVGGCFDPPSERERLWRELSPSLTGGSAVGAT